MNRANDLLNVRLQAKRIFAADEIVIENGIVEISNGLITSVEKSKTRSSNVVDLGEVTLIPGLVNAHTHLEFSDLAEPLGFKGIPFTDWLKLVIENRMTAPNKRAAITAGVKESIDSGTVAIGEIATAPVETENYSARLETTIFFERLSRNSEVWPDVATECDEWTDVSNEDSGIQKAISPHAPYSVHPQLLERLVECAIKRHCPLAIHLAESKEEIELLANQTGPFVKFLKSIGAWFPSTYQKNETILDYLEVISKAPRSLIVHCNYLTDEDIDFIAQHRKTMSVVYCPRTHDYFEHDPYPLEKFLGAGINLAIGTDSRASNPDLSLFNELKLIRQRFSHLNEQQILKLGSANGSEALQSDADTRQIAVGNIARFNVVKQSGGDLFDPENRCLPISNIGFTL